MPQRLETAPRTPGFLQLFKARRPCREQTNAARRWLDKLGSSLVGDCHEELRSEKYTISPYNVGTSGSSSLSMGVPFALAVAALGSFTNSPRCSPNDNASRSAVMAWDASGSSLGDDQSSMGSLFSSSRLDELGYGSGHSKATDDSGDAFEFLSRTRRLQQQQRARAPSAFFAAETPSHLRSSLSLEALASSTASGRRSFSMTSLLTSSRQFGRSGLLQSSVSPFFLLSRQPNEAQDQPNDDDNRARRQDAEDSSMATEQLPPISLHELFRFATTLETVVTAAGLLAAGVCGALVAISALIVGRAVAALSQVALASSSQADGASSTIKRAALELVVLGFTCWILSSAATASTARSSRRQLVRIRIALLEQLVALGDATVLDWLEQQPGTDAAQTIARSVVIGDAHSQALQWLLTDGLARSCRLMAQFMGAVAVALMTSWKLGLVAGGAGLPLLAVATTMIERCDRKEHEMAASSMSMQAHTVAAEALSSVRTLVAFNGQRAAQRAYTSLLSQAMREGCCDRKALALAHALSTGLSWTLLAVIVGYASSLSGSESTASDNEQLLQSALGLMMAVLTLQQLIPALFRVAAAQRSASPLFALLDTNPEVVLAQEERQADASYSPPRSVLPPSMRRQSVVELRDVHCPGLNGVSLAVASGERVAVVGKNCSVISSLLTRFGSPSRGQILLDGRDLQAINRRHLRAQLAVVPTVPVLFAGSIFDNIAMGIHSDSVLAPDPTASNGGHWPPLHVQQQVVDAAKLASVHELIMRLPDQYATRVDCKIDASFTSARFSSYDGEQNALTVGQMQLIVLARALIRYDSSRVLVIDRAAPHHTPQLQKADVDLVDSAICSLLQQPTGQEAAMLLLFSSRADANSSVLETNTGRSLVDRIVDIVGPSVELQEVEPDVSTRPDRRMERGISADSDQSSLMSDTSGDEIISTNDPERGGMSARSKRAATDASGVSAGEHELPWATLENCEYSFHSEDPATPVHVGNEDDGYADDEGSPSKERRQNAMKTAFEASGTTTRARQASVLSSYNSRHRMRAATLQSALPQTPHSLSSSSPSEDKWTAHTSLGKKMDALRSPSPSFGLWSALQFTRGEKRSLAVALAVSALLAFAKPTASAVIGMWVAEVLIHREGDSSTPIWWSVYCCTISAITFAIMQGALAYCSKRVTQSATIKLQTLHFRAMLAQPVRFFDEKAAEIEAITTSLAVHGPVVAGTLTGAAQSRLLEIVSLAFGSIVAVFVVTAVAAKSENSFWWEFFVPAVLGVLPLASIGEALVSSVSALASSSDRQEDSLLSSSTLKSNDNEAFKHVNETLAQLRTVLELGAEKPRCREFARLMEKGEVLTNKRFNSSIAAALVTSGGGLFLVRFTVVGILLFTGDSALEGSIGDVDTSDARDLVGAVAVVILVIVTVSQALGDTIGWWQSRALRVYESGAVICTLRDSAKAHAAMERDMNTVIFASSRVNALSSTSSTFLSTSDTNLQAVSKNNRLPTRQRLRGSVAFRRMSFAYDDQRARNFILYNSSMNIRAGETVALCGVPESGKSTILALFERFYDPTPAPLAHSQTADASGGIFFDGIDARALDARWLRDQMGLVALSQTAPLLLFKGSIADNISLGVSAEDIKGKPASHHCVSHEAVVEAAKAANAHTFISHLPDGYATRVDTLNASQALRVAIARAIVRNPALLLIDDVGAGQLDKTVATAIENVISRRKSSGKTTILTVQMRLAHTQDSRRQQRSSSLTAALNDLDGVDVDRWFLVNNGEITELSQQLEDQHEAQDQEQQGPQQQQQSRHPMVQFASTPDAEQLIDRFWSDIDDDDDDDDIEEAEPGSIHQSEHITGRRAGIAHAMRLPDELLSLSLPPSPVPAVAESPISSSASPSSSLASSTASYQSLFSV